MALIRHTSTDVERDVPEEAVPYFPDYVRVDADVEVHDNDGGEDFSHLFPPVGDGA